MQAIHLAVLSMIVLALGSCLHRQDVGEPPAERAALVDSTTYAIGANDARRPMRLRCEAID